MHTCTRKLGIISILLPLMLLLMVSCPMKREVWQFFYMAVNANAGIEKSDHSRICIVSFVPVAEPNASKKNTKKFSSFLLIQNAASGIVQSVFHLMKTHLGHICSCPSFIYFRKILIWFSLILQFHLLNAFTVVTAFHFVLSIKKTKSWLHIKIIKKICRKHILYPECSLSLYA